MRARGRCRRPVSVARARRRSAHRDIRLDSAAIAAGTALADDARDQGLVIRKCSTDRLS
jgi:hypothetical protein